MIVPRVCFLPCVNLMTSHYHAISLKVQQVMSRLQKAESEVEDLAEEQANWKIQRMKLEGELTTSKQKMGMMKLGALKQLSRLGKRLRKERESNIEEREKSTEDPNGPASPSAHELAAQEEERHLAEVECMKTEQAKIAIEHQKVDNKQSRIVLSLSV